VATDTFFTPAEAKAIADKRANRRNLNVVRLGFFPLLFFEIFRRSPGWHSSSTEAAFAAIPDSAWAWWLVTYTGLLGYFIFCWTSAFHETIHQTLSISNTFNKHLGRVIGAVIFIPYTTYRETHIRHHAYLNRPEDWELWPYSNPESPRWFRRLFVCFDLLGGLSGAIVVYGRIFFVRPSPISRESRRLIRNEYLWSLGFWGVLTIGLTLSHNWLNFVLVWLIPLTIAGFLQTGRKLTEHLGMASYDPLLGTRTVNGVSWWTRLCSFMNFDIFVHGPHHRHPRAAHTALGELMDEYIRANPDCEFPVYPSYWRATVKMLPWFFRNPGVGMNVGAAPPTRSKDERVQNFVADVSHEVLDGQDVTVGALGDA